MDIYATSTTNGIEIAKSTVVADGGGTKLYKHTISFDFVTFTVILNRAEPLDPHSLSQGEKLSFQTFPFVLNYPDPDTPKRYISDFISLEGAGHGTCVVSTIGGNCIGFAEDPIQGTVNPSFSNFYYDEIDKDYFEDTVSEL